MVPFAGNWRVMGRGVRAVIQAFNGHEVFDQSEAGMRVQSMLSDLGPQHSCCKVGGQSLHGRMFFLSADVDQAFESCHSFNVSAAWMWASKQFVSRFATRQIQIKRGKKL